VTTASWQADALSYIANPTACQRRALAEFEARSGGTHVIVDPSNPFMFLCEAATTTASAAALEIAANMRRVYPSMALSDDEVYDHMSDADYVGRFATPATGQFKVWLRRDEVYQRAVETGTGGIRKLTIPRNTEFHVAQTTFTMQYPIDIRIMSHDGLNVVYDTEILSPLQTLSTNQVTWTTVTLGSAGEVYLELTIPADQFQITSYTNKLLNAGSFSRTYTLTDQFYHARAYYSDLNGNWIEMATTHSDQVFDPFKPTLLLKLAGDKLTATIPTIYLTQQLVNTEMRLELYLTKGPIEMSLSGVAPNSFSATYKDLARTGLDIYSVPMTVFSDYGIGSALDVNGGTNAIGFIALRDRVITNALGAANLPITSPQLTTHLADRGYSMVEQIDQVTNRQYQATRLLPTPSDGSLISGAGSSIQTLVASLTELATFDYCVSSNGDRCTLLPNALYSYVNGVTSLVPEAVVQQLLALPVDVRARRVNESSYLYSPFHYVLDIADNHFHLRPYYFDNPAIVTKSFISENDSTGVDVTVANYEIQRVDGGYAVLITCASGDSWKLLEDDNAHCQLSFVPAGERDRAYQNGTLVGVTEGLERVYSFFIGSAFDVDASDNLIINTFQMYDQGARNHGLPLLHEFDVMFAATGLTGTGITYSDIDTDLGVQLLPADTVGISRERLNVRVGYSLDGLWAAARSVVGSEDYQRYTADVPWLYEQDVFLRDPQTGAIVVTIDDDNKVVYTYLHRRGDPILDQNNQPTYKYRAGDVVIDADGKPVAISSRKMIRHSDIMMFDGVYWFATDAAATAYRDSLPRTIVTWLEQDIAAVNQYLLEQTKLYLYTQSTIGSVPVTVGEGKSTTINAAQSFEVVYYVNGATYRDAELRASLERTAVSVIDAALRNPVVALNEITTSLTTLAGNDIIGVSITGLGGDDAYTTVTLRDDSARLAIKRIAVDKADGTITVRDDVAVSFILHVAT
jgi:hypothetical protein